MKKLLYYQQGGSDKHLRDIASMLRISSGQIDRARVLDLARKNQVDDLLRQVLQAVDDAIP